MLTEGDSVGPYVVGSEIMSDAFCSIHRGSSSDAEVWLKHYADPMMGLNEALALKTLLNEPDPRFIPYMPGTPLITPDSVCIFSPLDGFYPLTAVHDRHPMLDPRDMAWMYRRLLVPLGFAHQAGYVHGAVLPQNVWIHPEKHGLILTGWAHAVRIEELTTWPNLSAQYTGNEIWYPAETQAYPTVDIYMAAVIAVWLCGGFVTDPTAHYDRIPPEVRTVLNGSLRQRSGDRIQTAWKALEYFDGCIERLWGRKFRPFSMPEDS